MISGRAAVNTKIIINAKKQGMKNKSILNDTGTNKIQKRSMKFCSSIFSFTLKQAFIPKYVMNIEIIIKSNCKSEYIVEGFSSKHGLKNSAKGEAIERNIAGIIMYFVFCQRVTFWSARACSNFIDENIIMEYSFV